MDNMPVICSDMKWIKKVWFALVLLYCCSGPMEIGGATTAFPDTYTKTTREATTVSKTVTQNATTTTNPTFYSTTASDDFATTHHVTPNMTITPSHPTPTLNTTTIPTTGISRTATSLPTPTSDSSTNSPTMDTTTTTPSLPAPTSDSSTNSPTMDTTTPSPPAPTSDSSTNSPTMDTTTTTTSPPTPTSDWSTNSPTMDITTTTTSPPTPTSDWSTNSPTMDMTTTTPSPPTPTSDSSTNSPTMDITTTTTSLPTPTSDWSTNSPTMDITTTTPSPPTPTSDWSTNSPTMDMTTTTTSLPTPTSDWSTNSPIMDMTTTTPSPPTPTSDWSTNSPTMDMTTTTTSPPTPTSDSSTNSPTMDITTTTTSPPTPISDWSTNSPTMDMTTTTPSPPTPISDWSTNSPTMDITTTTTRIPTTTPSSSSTSATTSTTTPTTSTTPSYSTPTTTTLSSNLTTAYSIPTWSTTTASRLPSSSSTTPYSSPITDTTHAYTTDSSDTSYPGRLISMGQYVFTSSTYNNWTGSLAVDGDLRRDADECQCCAGTELEMGPYLTLYLDNYYKVYRIVIYGRTNVTHSESFVGLRIQFFGPWHYIHTIPDNSELLNFYELEFQHPNATNGIRIMSIGPKRLTICELLVYGDCQDYYFGESCTEQCDCNGEHCDSMTGQCLYGCEQPVNIENGNVVYNTTKLNSTAGYSCKDGYELVGDSVIRCGENQTWLGDIPRCRIRGRLISINKQVTLSSQADHYDPSFAVDGDLRTNLLECHCCAATKIKGHPYLQLDLGNVYNISRISIYGPTDVNASHLHFEGMGIYIDTYPLHFIPVTSLPINFYEFELESMYVGRNVTIALNRTVQMTICELIVFGDCQGNYYGDNCNKLCNFTMNICLTDCGDPTAVENGHVTYNDTFLNSTVTYTCHMGYIPVGESTLVCGDNQTWTGEAPECHIIDCGSPIDIAHGSVVVGNTTFNSTVIYRCDIGYEPVGNVNVTCTENGTWYDIPVCQIVDCGPPTDIAHGSVDYGNTTFDAMATYACNIGYTLVGNDSIACSESGTWTGGIPVCQSVDCGQPDSVKHGSVDYQNTTYNSIATYTCDDGYTLIGNNITTCSESGTWTIDAPFCQVVDCGHPPNITNGTYTLVGTTTYTSVALYKCNDGYRLNDTNNNKRCEADKTWKGKIGICIPIECTRLMAPDSGSVTYSNHNKTVTFSCNNGFTLHGFKTLYCLSGNWSGTKPTCYEVIVEIQYCESNTDSRGTLWNETSPGQIATSLCPDGQEGTISRNCSKDGQWKRPRYSCVKREISEAESKIDTIVSTNVTEEIKIDTVSNVLGTLSNSTSDSVASSSTSGLADGEIEKVTAILEKVASISKDIVVTENQTEILTDFIGTTSNLLNPQNSESFRALEESNTEQEDTKTGADKVLKVVSNFAEAIANSLDNLNGSKTIRSDNLVVTVAKLEGKRDLQFPVQQGNMSTSAEIPQASLTGVGSYSGILYHNLSGLLPPRLEGTIDHEINAAVIAMQLLNITGTSQNFEINLNFDNFKDGDYETHCCFWNYSRSLWDTSGCKVIPDKTNSSLTVCSCNHLTNFAILMNPYKTKNVDSEALDYISLVGCSISLLCLIVTIVMHAVLWRYVKSDRAVILINLCIALTLSYVTFIFGVDKTEHKLACTLVALALHYIYLVVFFLMLSEGIEILITVVYVFVMKSRLRWLLVMSWGVPAVIVGVSVAITRSDGYGSKKFCWLSVDGGLIWAFVGPALAIILTNFVQLSIVIKAMFKVRTLKEKSRIEKVKTGVRCLCVLLPLTGGTWVIGIFYVNEGMAWIQYVFAVLNTLQGVFIMLFHCITNSQMKIAIARRVKLYRASTAYSRSSNTPVSSHRPTTATGLFNRRRGQYVESLDDSRDLVEDRSQDFDSYDHLWRENRRPDYRSMTTKF